MLRRLRASALAIMALLATTALARAQTIPNLPAAASLSTADLFPVDQSVATSISANGRKTRSATLSQLQTLLAAQTFANPSATVGLTAVNGSATTGMRSDAAPALSQSIAPTMTGLWVFSNTTASTGTGNGAVVISGGLGIGGALNVGGTLNIGTPLSVPNGGTGRATLTANVPLIGNGAGAVAFGTVSGNTTQFATVSGTMSANRCLQSDASGNVVVTGGACTVGGGGGTVNSGTAGQMTWYATSGTAVSGNANATISGGTLTLGVLNTTAGGLNIAASSASAQLTIAPPATGTPTWTPGSSSGTPVVTATSPLVIAAGTGNITCSTCAGGASTFYNVKAVYGAVGDGVTDDTAAINSAITAANANGTGTVYFPAPTNCYFISSTLALTQNYVSMLGDPSTQICYSSGFIGNVIKVGTSSGIPLFVSIKQLQIRPTSVPASSAVGLYIGSCGYCYFDQLQIRDNATGIQVESDSPSGAAYEVYFDHLYVKNGVNGILVGNNAVNSATTNQVPQGVNLANSQIESASNVCVLLAAVSGFIIQNSGGLFCAKGLAMYPSANNEVRFGWIVDGTGFDTGSNVGVYIVPHGSGSAVSQIVFSDLWASSNGRDINTQACNGSAAQNVFIAGNTGGTVQDLYFANTSSVNGCGPGVELDSSSGTIKRVSFTGGTIAGNGFQTFNTYDNFKATGVSHLTITGGNYGTWRNGNDAKYGMHFVTGNDYLIVSLNDTTANNTMGNVANMFSIQCDAGPTSCAIGHSFVANNW